VSRHRLRMRTKLAVAYAFVSLVAGVAFVFIDFGLVDRIDDDDGTGDLAEAVTGLTVIVAAGVIGGWIVAGRALRPLRSVTTTTQRISAATLDERISLDGPDDELKEMADTVDALLARLEASFTRERRFVANASHELRTPLAVTRSALEVGLGRGHSSDGELRDAMSQALRATARSEALVNDLLLLARSEALDPGTWEPFDLAALAREVVDHFARRAADAGVAVRADLGPAPVCGVPGLLDRFLVNLVDNAIGHNVDGGRVEVHTAFDGTRAALTVANTCAEPPDTAVDTLFEAFQRGPNPAHGQRPPGHGLGLSIVRAIAVGHRADLGATLLADGTRFQVDVTFPPPRTPG
jgi:signal transduction histidine kinase